MQLILVFVEVSGGSEGDSCSCMAQLTASTDLSVITVAMGSGKDVREAKGEAARLLMIYMKALAS